MNLSQANMILSELRKIFNLPNIAVIDLGDAGVKLYLKKSLINESSFFEIKNFVEQHQLGAAVTDGYFIIESRQGNLALEQR